MRRFLAVLLWLSCAATAFGQSITVPDKVVVDTAPGLVIIQPSALDADDVRYYVIGGGIQQIPPELLNPKPGVFVGFAGAKGTFKVGVVVAKTVGGKAVISAHKLVIVEVGGGGPTPTPVPPGPNPPTPPDPTPTPNPAPIPATGFRVLIIEEKTERAKVPAAQLAVLFSTTIREYLNAKCVKGPDGKTPECGIFDKDDDVSGYSKLLADAMKRPRASTPWIIISDGKTGFEGPLPANVDETLKLLKKYGGE